MRSLSPETYSALENLSDERQWAEIHEWMEPEWVAWLAVRLEWVDDSIDIFPRGKWATIQQLQDLVRKAAREDSLPEGGEHG